MAKYFEIPSVIQEEIDKMINVRDEENLDQCFEDNIGCEAFISKLLYETNDDLVTQEASLAKKKRELRIKYITGNTDKDDADMNGVRLNRSEIDSVMDGNRNIIVLNQKIKELENIIKYYERALYNIRNKGFALKNILDYRKWKSGAN